jgi:predicted lactoylglutathione lyase
MSSPLVVIALPCKSLRKSFEFHRDGLGLSLLRPRPDGSLPEPVEFKINESTTLMLVPADGFALVLGENQVASAKVSECVIGLVYPSAQELDATFERALAAGASAVSKPHQEPWGYSATFRDPDGHTFLLSRRPSA